jgi:hypothetical protein
MKQFLAEKDQTWSKWFEEQIDLLRKTDTRNPVEVEIRKAEEELIEVSEKFAKLSVIENNDKLTRWSRLAGALVNKDPRWPRGPYVDLHSEGWSKIKFQAILDYRKDAEWKTRLSVQSETELIEACNWAMDAKALKDKRDELTRKLDALRIKAAEEPKQINAESEGSKTD